MDIKETENHEGLMMFEIRLFGWIRNEIGVAKLTMTERTVGDAFEEIANRYPNINKDELMQAIIFINSKSVTGKKRFHIRLHDGDELAILSPVSGG